MPSQPSIMAVYAPGELGCEGQPVSMNSREEMLPPVPQLKLNRSDSVTEPAIGW